MSELIEGSVRLPPRDEVYLARNEQAILIRRRHWAVLGPTIVQSVGAVVLALGLSATEMGSAVSDVLWLIALLLLIRLGWDVGFWAVDLIVVTDKRVFEVSGIITRSVGSMPLRMMTDLTYQRPPIGRILGYGTFIVESAGQDQALSRIEYLPDPDSFYQVITGLVFT